MNNKKIDRILKNQKLLLRCNLYNKDIIIKNEIQIAIGYTHDLLNPKVEKLQDKTSDTLSEKSEDNEIMVESKRYKDEYGNKIILERKDDDFNLRIAYSKESLGEDAGYDEWLITRKDFEKMKELDAQSEEHKCIYDDKGYCKECKEYHPNAILTDKDGNEINIWNPKLVEKYKDIPEIDVLSKVEDKEKNPAHFCDCGKFLGHRGFCSKECHDKHYDSYSERDTNLGVGKK